MFGSVSKEGDQVGSHFRVALIPVASVLRLPVGVSIPLEFLFIICAVVNLTVCEFIDLSIDFCICLLNNDSGPMT